MIELSELRKELFQTDHWILDGTVGLFFALWFGAFIQYGADSGQTYPDKILRAMAIRLTAFALTVLLAVILRNRIKSLRSWAWIGIVGGLVHPIVYLLFAIPSMWDYHLRFPETFTTSDFVSDLLSGVALLWPFTAIPACASIFGVRFLRYLLVRLRASIAR